MYSVLTIIRTTKLLKNGYIYTEIFRKNSRSIDAITNILAQYNIK